MKSARDLGFLAINVWSGLDYRGLVDMGYYDTPGIREERYRVLCDGIRALGPDLIALNEANPIPGYVDRLARDLGYDAISHVGVSGIRVGSCGIPRNLREGDALLARRDLGLAFAGRRKIAGPGYISNRFSFHWRDATQVLLGKIRCCGRDVYAGVTHWQLSVPCNDQTVEQLGILRDEYGYTRREYRRALEQLRRMEREKMAEARRCLAFIRDRVPAGAPLVLMGDFNAEVDWPEMRVFIENGFIDVGPRGDTWDPARNRHIQTYYVPLAGMKHPDLYAHLKAWHELQGRRIDCILCNDAIGRDAVRSSRLCCDDAVDGVHASDHFGVQCVLGV